MDDVMLTTIDNPYNPFTHWDEWYVYDTQMGYNTCSYLARVTTTFDDMTEKEESEAIDDAIDEIIRINPLGIYRKIRPNDQKTNDTTEK